MASIYRIPRLDALAVFSALAFMFALTLVLPVAASIGNVGSAELPTAWGSRWSMDAEAYRGQILRVTGRVRLPAGGSVRIRVDRDESLVPAFLARVGGEPTSHGDAEWTAISERVPIVDDAERLTIEIAWPRDYPATHRTNWIEAIEITPAEPTWYASPAPLDARSLEHLRIAARLYGAVRFFHPSDEAATANWDSLALALVRISEHARNHRELAQRLTDLLAGIAPTVVVRSEKQSQWDRAISYAKGDRSARAAESERSTQAAVGTMRWIHRGYAGSGPDVAYRSARERTVFSSENRPLLRTSRIELGGGLIAEIPTTLYIDEDGRSLPRVDHRARDDEADSRAQQDVADNRARWGWSSRFRKTNRGHDVPPIPSIPSAHDRTTRLAALLVAWSTLEQFHPWIKEVGQDWNSVLPGLLQEAALDRDREEFLLTLRKMLTILDDGHANAYPFYDEAPARLPLRWRWIHRDHTLADARSEASSSEWFLVITETIGNTMVNGLGPRQRDPGSIVGSPSNRLQPGDIVLSIDGQGTEHLLDSLSTYISASTEAWRRYRVAEQLASGWTGVVRSLCVRHRDGTVEDVTLSLSDQPSNGPSAVSRLVHGQPGPPEDRDSIERDRVAPVCQRLPSGFVRFDLSRAVTLDQDWAQLAGSRGVVFDLRGYPERLDSGFLGRLVDRTVSSPTWRVPVSSAPFDRHFETSHWNIEPSGPRLAVPFVFLADERAISKAETFLAMVSEHDVAPIVGSPSAGTFGNLARAVLPGGIRITWTGMLAFDREGRILRGAGIEPDIRAETTLVGIASGRDEPLERAIEVLKERRL